MNKYVLWIGLAILALGGGYYYGNYSGYSKGKTDGNKTAETYINSYDECIKYVKEAPAIYPGQCTINGKTYTEDIGNELEKKDLITISSPRPNATVTSPLTITGEAVGSWFFEASFPAQLYDANGKKIAAEPAMTSEDWTTDKFVHYSVTLTFKKPTTPTGYLMLRKDNPSGLDENEDFLKVPVKF